MELQGGSKKRKARKSGAKSHAARMLRRSVAQRKARTRTPDCPQRKAHTGKVLLLKRERQALAVFCEGRLLRGTIDLAQIAAFASNNRSAVWRVNVTPTEIVPILPDEISLGGTVELECVGPQSGVLVSGCKVGSVRL